MSKRAGDAGYGLLMSLLLWAMRGWRGAGRAEEFWLEPDEVPVVLPEAA